MFEKRGFVRKMPCTYVRKMSFVFQTVPKKNAFGQFCLKNISFCFKMFGFVLKESIFVRRRSDLFEKG
jgi:hypothetical protein